MPKKLTYEQVKSFIEDRNYQLLSNKYENCSIKLDLQCDNGHNFKMTYDNFKQGHRCPECMYIENCKRSKYKSHSYEYVKSYIENKGYRLISNEYIKSKFKLKMCCPLGHIFEMRFNNFKDMDQRCPICSGKQKYTYEYVKSFIEQNNYKLLSTEYINNNTKLYIKCNKGHEYKTRFSVFKQGHRCPECVGLRKYTYDEINDYVISKKYTLLNVQDDKLLVKCSKGHVYETNFYEIRKHNCSQCVGNARLTYNYVKSFIEDKNYQLISTEYINNSIKLKFKCPKDHEFDMRFGDFQQGQRCPVCYRQRTFSIPEKEIVKNVKIWYNDLIIENDRSQLKNPLTNRMLELDVYLPDIQKAIEYNGKHWHSDSYQIYKDKQKVIQCKQKGIDLLVIEEKD